MSMSAVFPPTTHTNTHYVRSITSNSASFPLHEARFLTEPEMGAKRNGEARTATSVAGAAVFWRNRVPRVRERHENERRRRPWRYKKLEGRCQHMDGNATRGTEGERGERVARSLARATKKSRRGSLGCLCGGGSGGDEAWTARARPQRSRPPTRENPPVFAPVLSVSAPKYNNCFKGMKVTKGKIVEDISARW